MSNIIDFVQLVARMRDAQRTYNSNMTRQHLEASSELEQKVDRELLTFITEQEKIDQLRLDLGRSHKTDEERAPYHHAE